MLVAVAALIVACFGGGQSPEQPLSAGFLLGADPMTATVPMAAFAPPSPATLSEQVFSGTLRLIDVERAGEPLRHLPGFEFEFVQRGSDVIPLVTGVQRSSHPYWEIMLLPGKAWQAADDHGWTRISLPFALQERAANCTHNGVMSWLFRDGAVGRGRRRLHASGSC